MPKVPEIHCLYTLSSNKAIMTVTNLKSENRSKFTGFAPYPSVLMVMHMFCNNNLKIKRNVEKVPINTASAAYKLIWVYVRYVP